MDLIDKGNYQIEAGLSRKDVEDLFLRKKNLERGILTGAEVFTIYSLSEEDRNRMVLEKERMPAKDNISLHILSSKNLKISC